MPDILLFDRSTTEQSAERPCPLTVDAKRLAELLGVGLRSIRTWNTVGKLPLPVRIGGRVLWRLDEIKDWLNAGSPDRKTWTAQRAAGHR